MAEATAYRYQPVSPGSRWRGWVIVLLLHLLLAWLLASAVGRKAPDSAEKPQQAVVIQEVVIAPPPPLPLPPIKNPAARATVNPPLSPPASPTVNPPAAAAPLPPSLPTATAPPDPVAPSANTPGLAPTVPGAPTAAEPVARPEPAPPAARAEVPGPAPAVARSLNKADKAEQADISIRCPIQVTPLIPRMAQRSGIQGVVKAQALIKDGVVREVTILSGPGVFHAAVREAMLQYRCSVNSVAVLATQDFNFKFD